MLSTFIPKSLGEEKVAPIADPREEIVTHLSSLRAFAITLTRNETLADDMVQETIVKAWTHFNQFTPGTNLAAWLFTILRKSYYSELRKNAREVSDHDGLYADRLAIKPDHDGRLQLRDFYRAFALLPVSQRETLALLAGAGYTYEEAARICGVAEGTIKSRANRARRRLTDLLALDANGAAPLTDTVTQSLVEDTIRVTRRV